MEQFAVSTPIYERKNKQIFRAIKKDTVRTIILKCLKFPSSSKEIRKFKREFDIGRKIKSENVVKYLDFIQNPQTVVIVEEDDDCEQISKSIPSGGFTMNEFLPIAVQIVKGIRDIHDKEITHKDIKPHNILWNRTSGKVKITDFSIASLLKEEIKLPTELPSKIEGTLMYLSPEQTGRMNRVVDYRTDFYSLGVTLFELLTGKTVFFGIEKISEIIHCHLAVKPPSLHDIKEDSIDIHSINYIPNTLCDLINKLLMKNAEDRYQSSNGILEDLLRIQANPKEEFKIAEKDFSERILISSKLYGREKELAALVDSYKRVCETGKPEISTVCGYSGIGKSSLINEARKLVSFSSVHFLSGKYDMFSKSVAYSAINQAFGTFILHLVSSPEDAKKWKAKILQVLGENARLVSDVIPELELLIGKQPKIILDPLSTKSLFDDLFRKFINLFGEKENPLVLCLDDLQWADVSSLNILKQCATSTAASYIYFIVSYRDNEVDSSHPTIITLENIRKENINIQTITLEPLPPKIVNLWISESLNCPLEKAGFLSSIIYSKTAGNPFFVKMFLRSLIDERLIRSNIKNCSEWNLESISNSKMMDNVVDFLISKMKQLSNLGQRILSYGSCYGRIFLVTEVAKLLEISEDVVLNELFIICNTAMTFQFEDNVYFGHDRVQEAAYQQLTEDEKLRIHLRIAKRMDELYNEEGKDSRRLFDLVDHYNIGACLIGEKNEIPPDLLKIIQLNLTAVEKAKKSAAFTPALSYIQFCVTYLNRESENVWTKYYDLSYKVFREKLELEYLLSAHDASEKTIEMLIKNAREEIERAECRVFLILIWSMRSEYHQAIDLGLEILKKLNIGIPIEDKYEEQTQIQVDQISSKLNSMSLEQLINPSPMNDPTQKIVMQIFAQLLPSSFVFKHDLYYVLTSKAVLTLLNYGMTPEGAFVYAYYSSMMCEKIKTARFGEKIGTAAIEMSDRMNIPSIKVTVDAVVHNLCLNFFKPLRHTAAKCVSAREVGLADGETQYSSILSFVIPTQKFEYGELLKDLFDITKAYMQYAKKTKSAMAIHVQKGVLFAIRVLEGKISVNDATVEKRIKDDICGMAHFTIFKVQLLYYFEMYKEAYELFDSSRPTVKAVNAHFLLIDLSFYICLTIIKLFSDQTLSEQRRKQLQEEFDFQKQQLSEWSQLCPDNVSHKLLLVQAELAKHEKDYWNASFLYEEAIKNANMNQFVQDEALSCELLGKFWIENNRRQAAVGYLISAYKKYDLWGAKAKTVRIREYLNDNLPESIGLLSKATISTNFISSPPEHLLLSQSFGGVTSMNDSILVDMQNVIKASQIISSEIELDSLLPRMMKLIIQTAGAQSGTVLLIQNDNLFVKAQFRSSGEIFIPQNLSINDWDGPRSIVEYVKKSGRHVSLGRAMDDSKFGLADPYVVQNCVKSLLCMPITKFDVPQGVLYVENNLASHVFSSDRVAVLGILVNQMAISLENATLVASRLDEQRRRVNEAETYKKKLEEFIDTVCHEIRNPLNGVYGAVTLLLDEYVSMSALVRNHRNDIPETISSKFEQSLDVFNNQIDVITKCAAQQKVIVDDVLDLSKLESNTIELNPVYFSLKYVFDSIMKMFFSQISQSKLDVKLDIPENIYCYADANRLSQIVINLLSNALKFTKQGYVEVSVRVLPLENENETTRNTEYSREFPRKSTLFVSVRDTGTGMNDKEKERLFDRFSQATRFISSEYGGSGLGLVISKKFVEMMGGEISVKSKKWFGSIFSFHISCNSYIGKEVVLPPQKPEPNEPENFQLNELYNILIVEDNMMNQRVLSQYLKQKGYSFQIASNGLEAVNIFKENQIDIILMDIEMPVMNGLEATRKIRKMEILENKPKSFIIGLSGNARNEQIQSAIISGMNFYLTKPIKREQVYEIISKCIESIVRFKASAIELSHNVSEEHIAEVKPSAEKPSRTIEINSGHSFVTDLIEHKFRVKLTNVKKSVKIVGDFNNWLQGVSESDAIWYEMKQIEEGYWVAVIPLPSGRYEFSYLVDGERFEPDPDSELLPGADQTKRVIIK